MLQLAFHVLIYFIVKMKTLKVELVAVHTQQVQQGERHSCDRSRNSSNQA